MSATGSSRSGASRSPIAIPATRKSPPVPTREFPTRSTRRSKPCRPSCPEADFFRADRQFIVARRAVKEIAVWFGSRLALHLTVGTPERIVISKARVPEFKAWLTSVQPAE